MRSARNRRRCQRLRARTATAKNPDLDRPALLGLVQEAPDTVRAPLEEPAPREIVPSIDVAQPARLLGLAGRAESVAEAGQSHMPDAADCPAAPVAPPDDPGVIETCGSGGSAEKCGWIQLYATSRTTGVRTQASGRHIRWAVRFARDGRGLLRGLADELEASGSELPASSSRYASLCPRPFPLLSTRSRPCASASLLELAVDSPSAGPYASSSMPRDFMLERKVAVCYTRRREGMSSWCRCCKERPMPSLFSPPRADPRLVASSPM